MRWHGQHSHQRGERMSFALINTAIAMPLPPARRMVLLQLSRMANQAGACWPSVQTLARQCCLSVRSVFNHLAALAKAGIIHRRNRIGRSTVYTVTAPVASSDPAASATPSARPAPASPGETTGEVMGETQTIVRQEPSVSAPEPVREPLPKPTRTPVPAAVSTAGLTVGSVVQAMRSAGLLGAYATPSLATLVATASGPHEFSEAASEASKRGKGFAWALARVAGKRQDSRQDGRQDAAASASSPPPVVHADQARTTVPSRPGRDPVLIQIEREAALAVPPPAGVREQLARLRAQIVQSISKRKTG
jgi:hypothetical protein